MDDLLPVFASVDRRMIRDRTLALQAAGIPFEVRDIRRVFTILVRAVDADAAQAEIAACESELREAPADPDDGPAPTASGWPGLIGYVAVVTAVFVLQRRSGWVDAGATVAGLVCEGQWWRTVTALTLHADVGHLLANIMFGALFGLLNGQLLGSGLAWLSILVAGAVGNGVNAWIHPPTHSAIGASTAVFAALGLLAAIPWPHRWRSERRTFRRLASVIAGAILLAMTGIGGERTDTLAHVTGFGAGLMLGVVYGLLHVRPPRPGHQWLFGLLALSIVVGSWLRAWP